jgi:F-box interacting protein
MATKSDKVSNGSYIPDEISFSILSKLPLKSLNRFPCASKSWSLLFQNPYFMQLFRTNFISMHRSLYNHTYLFLNIKEISPHPRDGSNLYLLSAEEEFKNRVNLKWPVSFQQDEIYIDMLDSGINDLLCFSDLDQQFIALWNPATNELENLPPSPPESLPFNTVWFHLHGYGYDPVNDDYKIIRRVYINQYKPCDNVDWTYLPTIPCPFWEIYSLRSDSWKRLDLDMPISKSRKVYLNGLCHWWAYTDVADQYMVSFNLSNDNFLTTHLPLDMQDSYPDEWVKRESDPDVWVKRYFDLVVLNGFVAMISKHVKTASFHIYVLGELGVRESWTKLFIVGPLPSVERPVGAGKKGDIFFIKNDNEIACFDLNTQTIEDLGVKGEYFCCHFAIYKKNLRSFRRIRS